MKTFVMEYINIFLYLYEVREFITFLYLREYMILPFVKKILKKNVPFNKQLY